jgi:long-subunit acyl-CoA synthetase (AMP-forming)
LIDAESGRTLTYAELGEAIDRASRGLAQHGFRQGDVLALYAANSPEYVIALHAAISAGGSVTTSGPLTMAEEVASQVADAGATWLAAGSAQLDRLRATHSGSAVRQLFVLDGERSSEATPFQVVLDSTLEAVPWVEIEPNRDLALLPYSSGTTGVAKGVELTHATLVHNLAQAEPLRIVKPDDDLSALHTVMSAAAPLADAAGAGLRRAARLSGGSGVWDD